MNAHWGLLGTFCFALVLSVSLAQYGPPKQTGPKKHRTTTTTQVPPSAASNEILPSSYVESGALPGGGSYEIKTENVDQPGFKGQTTIFTASGPAGSLPDTLPMMVNIAKNPFLAAAFSGSALPTHPGVPQQSSPPYSGAHQGSEQPRPSLQNNPFISGSVQPQQKPQGCGGQPISQAGGRPPCSGYPTSQQPGFHQPQPSQPGFTQPQPSQPGFSQPQPSQPGFPSQQPQQPGFPSKPSEQPEFPDREPQQPNFPAQQPQTSQPGFPSKQPGFPSKQPEFPSVRPQPQRPGGGYGGVHPQPGGSPNVQPQRPGFTSPQQPGQRPLNPTDEKQPFQPDSSNQGPTNYQPSPNFPSPQSTGSNQPFPQRPDDHSNPESQRPSSFPKPQQPSGFFHPDSTNPPTQPQRPSYGNPSQEQGFSKPESQRPSGAPTPGNPFLSGTLPSAGPSCNAFNQFCVPPQACQNGLLTQQGNYYRKDKCSPGEVCCKAKQPSYGGPTEAPITKYTGPLNVTPPPGCAAALKCVPEIYCDFEGVMRSSPVSLTREQYELRVPLTECQNMDTGVLGKCCRDPNYKDPWPAGMMMNKGPNDYDDGLYRPGKYPGDGGPTGGLPEITVNAAKQPQSSPYSPTSNQPEGTPYGSNPNRPEGTPYVTSPDQPQGTISNRPVNTPYVPSSSQPQGTPYGSNPSRPAGTPYASSLDQPQPYTPNIGQPQAFPPSTIAPPNPYTIKQPLGVFGGNVTPFPVAPKPGQTHAQVFPNNEDKTPYRGEFLPEPDSGDISFPAPSSNQNTVQPTKFSGHPLPKPDNSQPPFTQPFNPPRPTTSQQPTGQPRPFPSYGQPQPSQESPELNQPSPEQLPPFSQSQRPTPNVGTDDGSSPVTPGQDCGVRRPAQSANPDETGFGEFPWQATIVSAYNNSAMCSGALIAPNAVLTAAHCIQGSRPEELFVRVGSWKLGQDSPKPSQTLTAAATAVHPVYNQGSLVKDQAVIVTNDAFNFDEHVDRVCLPPNSLSGSYTPKTSNCYITGWGRPTLQNNEPGSVLHKVPVKILQKTECENSLKQTLGKYFILNDGFTCAAPLSQADLCKVDAGSPLVCDRGDGHYELIGVYSWDTKCESTTPGVMAACDTEWINKVLTTPVDKLREEQDAQVSVYSSPDDVNEKPGFALGYGK